MNRSRTLIATALFALGFAAAAVAADTQPPAGPTVGPKEDQRAVNTAPPKSAGKHTTLKHKKTHQPAKVAPMSAPTAAQ
jgi:hypothetical protein